MKSLADRVEQWAWTYKRVNSADVADLLFRAQRLIRSGERDPKVAAELHVCAAMRDDVLGQQSAAILMREAAEALI